MSYPPLATLTERPLHLDDLGANERWACSLKLAAVKRQGLDDIRPRFDWRCSDCVDAAAALIRWGYSAPQEWRRLPEDEPQIVSLDWLVRRARYWMLCGDCGEPGSPRDGVGACIYCGSPDGGDNALLHDPWK